MTTQTDTAAIRPPCDCIEDNAPCHHGPRYAADALDALSPRVKELEADRDTCAKAARHQADLKWEERAARTQAEAERDALREDAGSISADLVAASMTIDSLRAEVERLSALRRRTKEAADALESALSASQAREAGMRGALEREAAWNEAEATICDQQKDKWSAAISFTPDDKTLHTEMVNRCSAAAKAHRKVAARLHTALAKAGSTGLLTTETEGSNG